MKQYFKMVATILAIIFLFWLVASCNNAKHMQKAYPFGFYDAGGFKVNHSQPRDSIK